MTLQIALVLAIVVIAVCLFWWERVSADVTALGILLTLVFTGLLPANKAFDGFSSDAVIMILGLLILTAALERTGVVDIVGRTVLSRTEPSPNRLLLTIMIASAVLGAFISNTASTAFFLPVVFGIAKNLGVSVSKLLMPMAFASILTSSVTLVSTSTNMIVSGMMTDHNMAPMGMFEPAPVGLAIAVVGLIYLYIARRWIPDHSGEDDLFEQFGVRPYLCEVIIMDHSSLVGKTLDQARFGEGHGLRVVSVERDQKKLTPHYNQPLQERDILLVEGSQADIVKIKDTEGIEINADVTFSSSDLVEAELGLAEAIVLPGSPLIGRTLEKCRFRQQYDLMVLGLNHRGVNVVRKISQEPLELGDVLLLQGRKDAIARLKDDDTLHFLGPIEPMEKARSKRAHAPVAIAIFVAVLVVTAFQVMSLPIAAMLGALLAFLTGCITPEEAYEKIEWRVIILIGSMLGLGLAMRETGAADYLAIQIVSAAGSVSPRWLLTGFFILTVVLTQPMSNQAAAVVVLPVAIATALQSGLNPRTFAMMIAIAASTSYLTPLEPACVMVYGPGRYKFAEFFKIGWPLTVLIYLVAIILVPMVWPLK
ncbi:SLC13 family permease [bacterium]|nr:SLC13 family permease [bacterium]